MSDKKICNSNFLSYHLTLLNIKLEVLYIVKKIIILLEGIYFCILVISSWKQFNWHFISNQMALLSITIIINYCWPPLCNISKVPKKKFRLFSQIIDAKSVTTTTQNILSTNKNGPKNNSPKDLFFAKFTKNLNFSIWNSWLLACYLWH